MIETEYEITKAQITQALDDVLKITWDACEKARGLQASSPEAALIKSGIYAIYWAALAVYSWLNRNKNASDYEKSQCIAHWIFHIEHSTDELKLFTEGLENSKKWNS